MKFTKLSLVMPVYNEQKTLPEILNRIEATAFGIPIEVVIVNDASTDNTAKILSDLEGHDGYKIIHQKQNKGKSQTVKNGILQTTGDLVVIQDADLEYDPHDLVRFVDMFQKQEVDVIYGNRFNGKNRVIYWHNWVGNRLLSLISALFTGPRAGMWTGDMEVCYKMAKGDIFRELAAKITAETNFGFEPEITAYFSKYKVDDKHLEWREIPITYEPRTIAEGKHMKAFRDGIIALGEIVKYNLFR